MLKRATANDFRSYIQTDTMITKKSTNKIETNVDCDVISTKLFFNNP